MLQLRKGEPGLSAQSDGPRAPFRRRQVVLALAVAGVVLLVAASVSAITWRPARGRSTDRVSADGPSPTIPSLPGVVSAVPTTVAPAEPGAPAPALAPANTPAPPGGAPPPPPQRPAPACTLASGYPLTIPEAMIAAADGSLWFTQPGVARIGRLAPGGAYTSFAVSDMPGANNGIAVGPDGALWFSQNGHVGRITPSGDLRSYAVPSKATPGRIVAGPDGALWFVETNRSAIGRITTSGDVSELTLPGNGAAKGIVAGPDGALWVARDDIFKVTTSGDAISYPPAQFNQENAERETATGGIVVGKDSGIWFITKYALHRMTIDGHDTIQNGSPAVPSQQAKPPQADIASDRSGDFWISTIAAGGSNGTVERVPLASPQDRLPAKGYPGDTPTAMTTGPDGAAWVGTSPSTARGAPYGPSTILRLTPDGTALVKALPCPS